MSMKQKFLNWFDNLEPQPWWKFWNPMSGIPGGLILGLVLSLIMALVAGVVN